MSLFQFNTRELVKLLLAPVHRLEPVEDLLESALEPMTTKAAELDTVADDQLLRALWDGRFIVMREAIENFTGISGITVENVDSTFEGYLFLDAEPDSEQLIGLLSEGGSHFFQLSSESISTVNFEIGVPVADYSAAVDAQIRAEVDIFALANSNYQIITI